MNTKQTYVLSIGISSYEHLRRLACAAHDAQDLAETFGKAAAPAQVRLLLDEEATKANILRELAWLAKSASHEDTAVVFFSGHGGRAGTDPGADAYLCPTGAASKAMRRTGITSGELSAALRAVGTERLVVLLDTCYAGGIGEPRSRSAALATGFTARDVSDLLEGRGRVVMASSRPDELSWELEKMRNGLFTNYLLRGLRGEVARADGTVWVSELFGYVSRSVRQHGLQHPYQKAVGEDFVVIAQPRAQDLPTHAPRRPSPKPDQRTLRRMMRGVYNRAELSLLCRDLGLSLDDLAGTTLETQLMELIDHCHRHGQYNKLLKQVRSDRPRLL